MQSRRLLRWAFAISITVHVAALILPGWQLPEKREPPLRIEAKLMQMPVATSKPAPPPKPAAAPQAPPRPEAPIASLPPTPDTTPPVPEEGSAQSSEASQSSQPHAPDEQSSALADASEPAASSSSSSSSSAEAEPALAVQKDWPSSGCVNYVLNVTYGMLRGDLGHAEQCWQHDDSSYSARLDGRAAVAWRELLLEQRSNGPVLGGLPVSEHFEETVDKRNYETLFDPNAKEIRQNRNGVERMVPTGGVALDMLALMQFLALQPDDREAFDVFVVASRGMVSRVTVVQQAPGEVKLPGGTVPALRYRAEARGGELRIDVWISRELRNVPVRFRIDNKGDVFDFLATDITLEGKTIMRQPPPPPPNPADDSN